MKFKRIDAKFPELSALWADQSNTFHFERNPDYSGRWTITLANSYPKSEAKMLRAKLESLGLSASQAQFPTRQQAAEALEKFGLVPAIEDGDTCSV